MASLAVGAGWRLTAADYVAMCWWAGWLVCGIIAGCWFAFEVGKAGGSRGHALAGGLIRGALTGLVWPLALIYWFLTRFTRRG